MYTQFYGLREKPFSLSPDPRYLFLADSHREALAHLLYGIEQGEGFIAITGEVGTGKTTLCRTLLQRIDPGTEIAFIFNPQLSALELLQAISAEFGLECSERGRRELTEQLNRFLLAKKAEGRRVLLIIDEAQNLAPETLEQVRLLSNLETDTAKLIQIVLIGQPELDVILESPELRQLRQRISVRWRLQPLSATETRDYVRHRLRIAAGAPRDIFTELSLREIHRRSKGVPRVINLLCDRALLAGYASGASTIGLGIVTQTDREIRGGRKGLARPLESSWRDRAAPVLRRAVPAVALLALGFAGSFAWQTWRGGVLSANPPAVATAPKLAPVSPPATRTAPRPAPAPARGPAPVPPAVAQEAKVPASVAVPAPEAVGGAAPPAAAPPALPSTPARPIAAANPAPAVPPVAAVSELAAAPSAPPPVAARAAPPAPAPSAAAGAPAPPRAEPRTEATAPPSSAAAVPRAAPAPRPPKSAPAVVAAVPRPGAARSSAPRPQASDTQAAAGDAEFARILSRSAASAATARSVDAALAIWGAAPSGAGALSLGQALGLLSERGVATLPLRDAGIATLRYFDRPTLLRLRASDGESRLVLLEGITDQGVYLAGVDPAGALRISLEALRKYWFGAGYVLWRDFESLPVILTEGHRGAPVAWLQHSLGRLGFYDRPPSGEYDAPTMEAVRAFQESRRLGIDGTVGPMTKMALYEALGGYSIPRLSKRGGRG